MIALWQAMAELYGHRWLSAYGSATETRRERTGEQVEVLSSALKTWRSALQGVTDEELSHGIQACTRRGDEWPPTAGGFRQMCLARRPRTPERSGPPLPPPPADKEQGRRAIQDLKRILGRG